MFKHNRLLIAASIAMAVSMPVEAMAWRAIYEVPVLDGDGNVVMNRLGRPHTTKIKLPKAVAIAKINADYMALSKESAPEPIEQLSCEAPDYAGMKAAGVSNVAIEAAADALNECYRAKGSGMSNMNAIIAAAQGKSLDPNVRMMEASVKGQVEADRERTKRIQTYVGGGFNC